MKKAWNATFSPSQGVVLNTGIILQFSNLTESQISIFFRDVNVVCVKDTGYRYLLIARYAIVYYNNTLAIIIPLLSIWPCGLLSRHYRFGGGCCLLLQGKIYTLHSFATFYSPSMQIMLQLSRKWTSHLPTGKSQIWQKYAYTGWFFRY